jgi:hypothetical protein
LSTTCDSLEERKSALFLKNLDIIKELEGPLLIKDSMLLNKDQVEEELSVLRVAWGTKFDDLTNFPKEEL